MSDISHIALAKIWASESLKQANAEFLAYPSSEQWKNNVQAMTVYQAITRLPTDRESAMEFELSKSVIAKWNQVIVDVATK